VQEKLVEESLQYNLQTKISCLCTNKTFKQVIDSILFTTKVHHQHRTAKLNKLPKWTYVKEQNIPGNIAWIVVSKSFQS